VQRLKISEPVKELQTMGKSYIQAFKGSDIEKMV
jgi:hypothetical protein